MKTRFIVACVWMFGGTKGEAAKVYKTADAEYIAAVVSCYEAQCLRTFSED